MGREGNEKTNEEENTKNETVESEIVVTNIFIIIW